ncbi:hypothetical protein [Bacillus fungorum]|uniref:hypothetical protein n=1 Tax=Bacillus fungorum TaxID=2039284 RepID=UPI003F55FE93
MEEYGILWYVNGNPRTVVANGYSEQEAYRVMEEMTRSDYSLGVKTFRYKVIPITKVIKLKDRRVNGLDRLLRNSNMGIHHHSIL